MPTHAYFEDIQSQIIKELQKAKQQILLAVAWFTDATLLEILCQKAQKGVKVSLLLQDDQINRGNYAPNFDNLQKSGGEVLWVKPQGNDKMHNKFCVIDSDIVLTGSYNWTNQAQRNDENITVQNADPNFAKEFIIRFEQLRKKHFGTSDSIIDYQAVRLRLDILKNVISLQDSEDIENQSKRLGKLLTGNIPENLANIMAFLESKNYGETARLIQVFLQNMAVAHYIDPEISGMSLEIKALEIQISSLENEKADIEKLLANYSIRYHQVLGDLLLEIMDLQKRLSKKEDEKQEKQKAYNEYKTFFEENNKKTSQELSKEEKKELKDLYRKSVRICHPDVVSEEYKIQSERIFHELTVANNANDLKKVKEIHAKLEKGIFTFKHQTVTEKEKIRIELLHLNDKRKEILQNIHALRASDQYLRVSKLDDWNAHFEQVRAGLLLRKKEMESLLAQKPV